MTARIDLSCDDLSRLIDGLEGTSHLDSTDEEQKHTDELLARLTLIFEEEMNHKQAIQQIADVVFS